LETPHLYLLCRRCVVPFLLTFICCAVAAWFLFFAETSGLVIAFVAWLLAWGVALVMRMSFNRRLA
jgi:hypothetical protein